MEEVAVLENDLYDLDVEITAISENGIYAFISERPSNCTSCLTCWATTCGTCRCD